MLFAAAPMRPLPPLLPRVRRPAMLPGRLAALRSDHVPERRDPPPVPIPADEGVPGGASGALKGSDVLQALQRAVAEREARKPMSDQKKRRRRRAMTDGGGGEAFDHSEQVRPIEIRSDWGRRIHELERRIQELRSKYP